MNHMKNQRVYGFECSILGAIFIIARLSYRQVVNYILDDAFGFFGSVVTFQAHKM